MVDFSNYSALREDGTVAKAYPFDALKGAPGVMSRPATTANQRYNSARLKALGKRTAGGRKKLRVTSQTIEAARREDAEMLAKYCAVSWTNPPLDASGQPVPFSAEACQEFFLAIPDWMFDEYRNWVADPLNFVDEGEDDEGEALAPEELGNSSLSTSDGSAALPETGSA